MPLIRKGPTPAAASEDRDPAALLAEGTVEERWSAARRLDGSPEAVDALARALLREEAPRVREAILTALARAGTRESAAAVLPHLRSDEADLRTGALDALRAMPEAAAGHLPALLDDPDPDVRLLACELARGLQTPEAAHLLAGLVARDREANVCAAAVEVLAEIGGPDLLPALEGCAARFPDDPFLGFAIRVARERIAGSDRRG